MADDGWEVASGGDGWDVADGWEPASPPRDIRSLAKKRLEALTGGASAQEDQAASAALDTPSDAGPIQSDLAGGGVRRYEAPDPFGYQSLRKDIRPEARRRYAALTDQAAPLEEGPPTPKFQDRLGRARTAAIPPTSAAPSLGGRFLRSLDESIGEQNPTGMKPSEMLAAPGELASALNDYTDNAALLPISKLAAHLPDDPTWIPGAPALQALANTRFGRGAVRGAGVDVGEGPISYKQGIEAALKVPEGFSKAGDIASLGAMGLPVVGPAILAGMIPEQIGQAGADLGDIAGGVIGGDPEGAGERLPGAAVNAGMLAMMGAHGMKGLREGREAAAAAKDRAAQEMAARGGVTDYDGTFRAPPEVMAAAAQPAPRYGPGPDPFATVPPRLPDAPAPLPPLPEGRSLGPLPVPPDITALAGPRGWADPEAAPGGQHPAMRRTGPIDIQGENVPPPELQPRVGLSRKAARVLEQDAMVPEGKDETYTPTAPPPPQGPDLDAVRQAIDGAQPGTEVKRIRKALGVTTDEARQLYAAATAPPETEAPVPPPELPARVARGIAPRTPPAAENIQAEPQKTIDAQMQAFRDGRKDAVLIPRQGGHPVPETPEGFAQVSTPAGVVFFDPAKVDAKAVAEAATSGKGLGKILGMGVDERPEGGTIVTARTPEGTEVQSAQATPEQVPAAVEAARKVAGPEGNVTEGTTEQIVAERQAGLESEKGDIALRVAKAVYGPNAQPASVEFVRRVLGGDVPPKAVQGAVEAKRHAGSNIEAAGDARVVRLNGPDGSSFVIHESPSEPGKWQVTRFEGDAPTGHVVFGSREDAIRSASGQRVNQQAPVGDRRYVVEPGKAEAPPRIQIEPGRTSDLGGEEERDAVQPPGGREEVRSAPEGAGAPDVPAGEPGAGEGRTPSGEESRGTAGRRATIWVKPDQPIEVEHRIVEAGDVVPSHDAEGRIDPRYPTREGLQPRDRSRDESVRQITTMARNLNPALLGESLDATTGAPVVTDAPEGGLHPVESGNGRAAAIREAYRTGRAGAYRERLEADAERYGMTPEEVAKMREPMLVRSRVTELSPEEQRQFTRDANASAALRMGAAEQATSDAAAMTPEILADFLPSEDGDVLAASNRRFLRRFFDEVVPETDRGELIDANGNPNLRAVQRIKAAIMGKAYGQDRLLARALEAADDNTRTVSAGLLAAAPRVAKVRSAIEAGDLHPVDFLAPIKEAVDHLYSAKDMKLSVPDYMAQRDMFAGEMSPEGSELLAFMDRNKRSAKKIGGMVDSIARAVEGAGHPGQTDLFGGEADAPRTAEIYSAAKRIYEARHEDTTSAQAGLFDQAGGGGPDRGESPGAGPAGGGGASGGGGGGEPGVYGSPAGRPTGRSLVRSRGGLGGTPESEPVRPGGARSAAVRPDVERYDSPSDAPRPATMAGPGTKAETNPREIVKELETVSGTPIRYGHGYFAPRRAMGWFDPRNNAIRLRTAEDIVTAAHEVGHSLHKFVLQDRQGFPRPVATELDRLGRDLYGSRVPNGGYIREGMAEYVAKYLIGDDMTKDAPAVHSWVRSNMPAEKLKALDAARELYEKWDVAGSVGQVKGKMVDADTSFVSRMKDGLDKLVRMAAPKMWTNKFSGLDEAMREVTDQLGLTEVHPMQDVARLAAALEKNATGSAYAAVTEGVPDLAGKKAGAGLKDALDKIGFKRLEDFAAYAYARRAVDLWERRAYDPDTKKRTGDPTPINPGISLRVAKHAVQQLESPEFRDALDKVTEWSNHLIDYVVKSGGLTPEEAVIIREANPVYVPLKRFFEESVQRGESGGAGGGLKRIKGSGRSVLNPVYSLVEHAATMIRLGDRLRVARAVADLVDPVNVGQSGTKGYGGLAWFAEKIQAPKDSTSFGVADIKKQLEAAGADLTGADLGRVLTVFQNAKEYHGKQNIISIVRNGTREFYEVDPRVYEVLMRTEPHAVNPVMQALQAAKRGVQLGATGLNAGFSLVSNVLRDMPTSSIYSKSPGLVTPIDTFKAVWKEIQKSPEAQRWERGGGSMSTLIGQDRLASRRIIEEMLAKTPTEKGWVTFKHPVDALRKGLGIFESGPRIAEYERMLKVYEQKYGVDSEAAHLMAMLASKDVTVNFTRAGIVSEAINRIVPFFNARIQGASKFYRTFGGDYLESRGTARQPDAGKAALAATAKAMAWITVPTFALWVANKDEEWYQELPAWQKGAFWVWSPDHGKTKYRIPKPMELGWVFGSLPEAAWDYAYRQNKRGVMDALAGTVNSLMPIDVTRGASSLADLIPAGAKPLLEFGINYDAFRNRPIVDPFLERRKLPKDQYQRQTSETAKKLGEWLNISPSKIDHLAGGLTGGLAIDAVKAMELAVGARKAGSIEGLYDVPVLNRLALRPAPGASVDHMHEQDALLRQKVGSKVATEEEKATLKRIAAAKTAIDHARLAAEGAKGDDLHALNTWSTHMAQWALGKRAEMPEEELEALEEKFPSEEWGKAAKAMRRKIPTYEAEAPPE